MIKSGVSNVANLLTPVDDLFTTQAERDEAQRETIMDVVPLANIRKLKLRPVNGAIPQFLKSCPYGNIRALLSISRLTPVHSRTKSVWITQRRTGQYSRITMRPLLKKRYGSGCRNSGRVQNAEHRSTRRRICLLGFYTAPTVDTSCITM